VKILWAFSLFCAILSVSAFSPGAETRYLKVRKENVAPGIQYYQFRNEDDPMNFNVLRAKWRESFILPRTMVGDGHVLGLEPVSEQAREVSNKSKYAVAAVNGDFYLGPPWDGVPLGVLIVDREIISAPTTGKASSRATFFIDGRGHPDIDTLVLVGDLRDAAGRSLKIHGVNRPRGSGEITLYTPAMGDKAPTSGGTEALINQISGGLDNNGVWRCYPGQLYKAKVARIRTGEGAMTIPKNGAVFSATGGAGSTMARWKIGSKIKFHFDFTGGAKVIKSAVSGWPLIVDNHHNARRHISEPRHPRTAIGFNDQEIIVATIDGRRAGWSRGMTLYELGELMQSAGCKKALNLDGGGSTTMWVRGKIRNKPSDNKERSVANGFVFFSTAPHLGLSRIVVDPPELAILTDEHDFQFTVTGQDKYFNPADFNLASLKWQASPGIGVITDKGAFNSGNQETSGFIKVATGGLQTTIAIHVYREPPQLQTYPKPYEDQHLFEGETLQIRTAAYDHKGNPVVGSYDRVLKWTVTPPQLGAIDNTGLFTAGKTAMAGYVSVSIGSITRRIKVSVGTIQKLLDGFEVAGQWTFGAKTVEGQGKGSFQIRSDAAHSGSSGGIFKYIFDDEHDLQGCYISSYIPLDGSPMAISLWVRGDGSLHQLRIAYRDSQGARFTEPFTEEALKDTNWHMVKAPVPEEAKPPLRIESIYILKTADDRGHMSGNIKIDDLSANYPPQ